MKPRVVHLIDSFRQGGSESQGLKLALAMEESGRFDVELFCLNKSGPLVSRLSDRLRERVQEFRLTTFYDFNMGMQVSRLARLLKQLDVQVVHTHDFYTNIFGGIAAALAGVPVTVASRREGAKRSRLKRLVERLVYRRAAAIIANCERVRQELIAEGVDSEKIITVYNGVDTSVDPTNYAAAPFDPNLRRPLVTIVANLRPVKDHFTFLAAAKIITESFPDVSFAVAGEGVLESELRRAADELGISESVVFLGRVEEVQRLLHQSDVCVLTSRSEGFPNAILEYMAAGKPVVSSNVGGISEAVIDGSNGFLVETGDAQGLAERILWLLNHPATAREMGHRGFALAVERYSSTRQLDKVESLYASLLSDCADGSHAGDKLLAWKRGL